MASDMTDFKTSLRAVEAVDIDSFSREELVEALLDVAELKLALEEAIWDLDMGRRAQ